MTENYFIIKNDLNDTYKIEETDSEQTKMNKIIGQKRDFATYNPETKTWTMQLPKWFCESEFEDKAFIIESFNYYKPDGTMDLGTSLHCPLLSDGEFAQHDNMICMANDGIERVFYIDGRTNEIEFWFRDYMSDENLPDKETLWEQKKNEKDQPLYYYNVPIIINATSLPEHKALSDTGYPVLKWIKNPAEGQYGYILHNTMAQKYYLSMETQKDEDQLKYRYPCYTQHEGVWHAVDKFDDIEKTLEPTDFIVMEPFLDGGKKLYLYGDNQIWKEGDENEPEGKALIYSIAYDQKILNETGEAKPYYWKIFNASYEGKVPVLTDIKNVNGETVYLQKFYDEWDDTIQITENPMYIPKPCWDKPDDIFKIRYYKFKEGTIHKETTEETDLPVYVHLTDDSGKPYYAYIKFDTADKSVKLRHFLCGDYSNKEPEADYLAYVPVYIHKTNEAKQKLYWSTVAETTVETEEPVLIEKEYPAAFVLTCRLRC